MSQNSCPFNQALEQSHRADPYGLYAELPKIPTRLDDGQYVITSHAHVTALLHDARLTSIQLKDGQPTGEGDPSLLDNDPPSHDRFRRILMRQFGPPNKPDLVSDLEGVIIEKAHALIDAFAARKDVDLVDAFCYRLPLAIIMKLLDIPDADEPKFHDWVATVAGSTGGKENAPETKKAFAQLGQYLVTMANERRGKSGTDLISGLVNDDGPDGRLPAEMVAPMTAVLLIAGHETTVNLIANGIVTLLAAPNEIARMLAEPEYVIKIVEELLRFQPPVQLLENRSTVAEIEIGGVTIPANTKIVMVLAGANRDATAFPDPDAFKPDRHDNRHLGFGSGIHSCFGAPLARLEGQIALRTLFERLVNPRLLQVPPPYRESPLLRGPSELQATFDGVRPRMEA